MTIRTIPELKSDISSRFPDNTSGLITPLVNRTQLGDMVDSCLNRVDTQPTNIVADVDFINGLTQDGHHVRPNNEIIVNSLSDLPAPIGGVITLAAGLVYVLSGIIDIGTNRIVFGLNSGLRGGSRFADGITYSGTGAMFTSTVTHTINEISIFHTGATGSVFNVTGSGSETLVYTNSFIAQAYSAGTITSWRTIVFRSFSVTGCTNRGILFAGACSTLSVTNSTFANNAGTHLNLGTATFDSVQIDSGNRINPAATQIGISGAASSANINAGGHGIIHGTNFGGNGTYLSGITTSDTLWHLNNNGGSIGDSKTSAQGYITANANTTTFTGTGPGNEEVVNFGTGFTTDSVSRFTISNAGVITYIGLDPIDVMIDSSIFASVVGGTARQYIYYWYKSGTKQTATGTKVQYDGSTPAGASCTGLMQLVHGDTIDLRIQAVTAATTVTVDTVNINLFGL